MSSVIVTCGPAYEPIDEVRRITNHSTGELGIRLANRLSEWGFATTCFVGEGATCPKPLNAEVKRVTFTTNGDLLQRLTAVKGRDTVVAVFHAAALCDFRPRQVLGADGAPHSGPKISSREGTLTLVLEPSEKVIGHLRGLFPSARLVGWKYELVGSREDAMAKGLRQIHENQTDACVVNGQAYGRGFGVLGPKGEAASLPTKKALGDWLARWLRASRGSTR